MLGMVSRQMDKISSGGDARFFSNVERTTPVRAPDMTPDVLVPLAQMGMVGLGAFCITTSVCMFIISPVGAISLGLGAAGIAIGAATYNALAYSRRTIYAIERYKDNLTATTTASAETIIEEIELTVTREDLSAAYPPIQRRTLPTDTGRFRELAQAAIKGQPLTQSEWAGSDKPFSRSEFDNIAQTLMELGIMAWRSERDPAQGRVITAGGRHALMAWMDGRMELGGE